MIFSCTRISVRWQYLGILFLLPIAACQSDEYARFENSTIIDELLVAAPQFVINTDIDSNTERWVATTKLGQSTDSLILSSPSHMIAIGDSIYLSENFRHTIYAVGADGYLSRQIGRLGQGPREFAAIRGLQYSGAQIFVQEIGRLQVFTETFEHLDLFFSLDFLHKRFSVSREYMFLQCPSSPTPKGPDWLVCARSTSPPHNWIESIKLLPNLNLPNQTGENVSIVTVSPKGNLIALAYAGLPFIFVYDDQFKHVRTIRFDGKKIQDFHSSGSPDGVPVGAGAFTQEFLHAMKFLNSRHLIARVHVDEGYYVFDLSEDKYSVAKKIVFRPINDTEDQEDIFAADFLTHKNHLYVSSIWEEYVYGYPFSM